MKTQSIDTVTQKIIGCAIEVHKTLGPGLLESIYETSLFSELINQGMIVEQKKIIPLIYKGIKLGDGYRIDLLVEDTVIVEIKAVENLTPIHKAQVISYLKLSGCKTGLLINFNVRLLKDGLFRLNSAHPQELNPLLGKRPHTK